ncbi:group 1 glycosyl transferase [Sulfuricella denitrificans skB26]|uniref:Group 1 glycosyl transferase n=1 Tax=Sulfuricella denitrificans (strain DSM 22764 / NBRC 105220 / skB26) TaxID=1163617 RepID=S6AKP6_SULDS|nr:glycosyltransferase [Sulfuricella denitrificans]BAN35164.1 group 1 glycosyl transferase [Sulfuricella denitrificans skB26]
MQLRILHVIASVNPTGGGPIEGVKQLAKINENYGHKIEILSLDDPASEWVGKFPHPVHAMGPASKIFGYTPRLVPWLRANAHNYDVVVVNAIWGYNCFGTWLALRKSSLPYYVYTHGMLDPWFKYRYPLKHLKKMLYWPWGVYPALRDARGVMFTCEEERMLARESFWLYDCNEIVVNYGTPGAPDQNKDYGAPFLEKHPELKNFRRFVFLGRVHPKKGPDILIESIAKLRDKGLWDMKGMRLIMAGPVDGPYAESLKSLSRRLGVDECIYWTGMLLGDDKWGALQCSEAFVLPSHQENFGIAVAESLSVGVPVLISKAVNIWRPIVMDGAGLAEEDTVPGCVAMFERWFSMDTTHRELMRSKSHECFASRFTSRNAAISLLSNIYQVIYAEKHESSRGDALRTHAVR